MFETPKWLRNVCLFAILNAKWLGRTENINIISMVYEILRD